MFGESIKMIVNSSSPLKTHNLVFHIVDFSDMLLLVTCAVVYEDILLKINWCVDETCVVWFKWFGVEKPRKLIYI